MENNLIGQIIFQLILIFLNAIFACAEIAVISMSSNKLEKMAEDGDKRAVKLQKLTVEPAKFLATIQVAITLSGFLGSAFAADGFSGILVSALVKTGIPIPERTLSVISVVIITMILSFITLVCGELVPKRLAMRNSEGIALGISGLVSFISKLFAPIVWLLTKSTNGVLKLLGIDPNEQDEEISEEEIRMMASSGSEKGIIDEEENEIIQNLFDFDDMDANEIATHRTEMDVLWTDDDMDKWRETINTKPHSFYPICQETSDNIIGVLSARKYFRLPDFSREYVMENAVDDVFMVPESMSADMLLRKMKENRNHFAIVTDEFGGTYGIVTMTDVLEKLVGDFDDDDDAAEFEPLRDGSYRVYCTTDLDKFEKKFKLEIESDSATIGGWVTEELNKMPEKGDGFIYEGYRITIIKTNDKRPLEIKVEAAEEEDAENDEKSEKSERQGRSQR